MKSLVRIRAHWPEYLMEALCLGLFMISACTFLVILEHPDSPVRQCTSNALLRRALMGVAMGGTAIALIYSPWGKRSGAHMNPAVTLAFLRLRKIHCADAFFYIVAQFLGGIAGVWVAASGLRTWIVFPSINFAVTAPGPEGVLIALLSECVISAILFATVVRISNSSRPRYAGVAAGVLVAAYITFEAPLSGMSMNPARTFASAFFARSWVGGWIYFVGPPLAMIVAGRVVLWLGGSANCAKLVHPESVRCIHCGHPGTLVSLPNPLQTRPRIWRAPRIARE